MICYRILIGILCAVLSSCGENDFVIIGKTNNLPNGTKLYLEELNSIRNRKIIDSVEIKKGTFVFRGHIEKHPQKVVIRTNNFTDFKYFWLDKGEIFFNAHNAKLLQAKISGSFTEDLNQILTQALANADGEENNILHNFILQNPNNILSASIIEHNKTKWGTGKVSLLYENLSADIKESIYGKKINDFIALSINLGVSDKYVNFVLVDTEEKERKLSELEGKVILLDFWASWCLPCRKKAPFLRELYDNNHSLGLEIFSVSEDRSIVDNFTQLISSLFMSPVMVDLGIID